MAENPNNEWSKLGKALNLFQYTAAVLFFGTPFRGTHEWYQKELPRLAKDLTVHVDNKIFETFEQISEILDQLRKDLLDELRGKNRPNIGCLAESQLSNVDKIVDQKEIPKVGLWYQFAIKIKILNQVQIRLVQRNAAILEGPSTGQPRFINRTLERNHFNLHNFDENDSAFATVEWILRQIVPENLLANEGISFFEISFPVVSIIINE